MTRPWLVLGRACAAAAPAICDRPACAAPDCLGVPGLAGTQTQISRGNSAYMNRPEAAFNPT